MKIIIVAAIIVLALLSLNNNKGSSMELSKNDTILAFGDSLTYGFGADREESYPSRLTLLSGYNVINAGVNGDTSEDGLKRLAPYLENPSVKLMILFFGGNDILQKKSMLELKQNLLSMIDMAKEKNIEILLVSVPNISLFGLSSLDLYEDISDEEDIPLLKGMLSDILSNPSEKSDYIHPNAKGYEKMAKEIYKKLKKEGWTK
ncbi:lipolytic enzyme, G-D-S-L [hydrothermal vent metagenome]|uniref:Lipolytic enzyme, G-D-S-L n=1 Tax=hydrothermal vent metagenome TaxID=652676 RepID=A0A1W1EFE4_9ZZZZ